MRIRTLVPALACLAAAPLATAADTGPTVKIDGFVDSILYGQTTVDSDENVYVGAKRTENDSNTGFAYQAKLGVAATINEKVRAQVDLFITGDNAADDVSPATENTDQIYVRQAYGVWKINPEVELKTGKFISDIGWVAAYAPGLYRVQSGPITDLYGVDQVGANVKWSKDALTVALTVANGFFGESYNENAQSLNDQKNESYAWGVDAIYKLGDKGEVNVELVYDMEANPDASGAGRAGGNGMHFGLNGTFTPNEQLTAGAEFIYQTVGVDDTQALVATNDDQSVMAFMVMGNYKLGSALPVPASVTGMFQWISTDNDGFVKDDTLDTMELSLALLTQPAGTDKFGANFEIYYQTWDGENAAGVTTEDKSEVGVGAELLYVF